MTPPGGPGGRRLRFCSLFRQFHVNTLVLAYHDVFALESNELGCTSAIEHEIRIENDEPFKEWFQHIPLPLLEEVRASLQDMLQAGVIRPSQSPWCNVVIFVQKKDGTRHYFA